MPASAVPAGEPEALSDSNAVRLTVGRSTLIDIGAPISRVSLTSADVADALVTSPNQLLVHGKVPGAISMFVWNRGGSVKRYEIVVQRDLASAQRADQNALPWREHPGAQQRQGGRAVRQRVAQGGRREGDGRGRRLRREEGRRRHAVGGAAGTAGAAGDAARALRGSQPQRDHASSASTFFTSPTGVKNTIGRIATPQVAGPTYTELAWTKDSSDFGAAVTSAEGKINFGDFLNLFFFNQKYDLGVRDPRDAAARAVPEPRRAEPGCRERQGSQLPRRRRVPGSGRAGLGRQPGHLGAVQGIRCPPELHADDQRRPRAPQGETRGQHARLRQRAWC